MEDHLRYQSAPLIFVAIQDNPLIKNLGVPGGQGNNPEDLKRVWLFV